MWSGVQAVEITVGYPYGMLFNITHQNLKKKFEELHPDIKINFRSAYKDYEDCTERVLRESITRTQPDVSFQGLNRIRIFVERGIALPFDKFIEKDRSFLSGLEKAVIDIGRIGDKIYALPFAISTPVVYYNADIVRKAGGNLDNLPTTWDGIIKLAKDIDKLPGTTGIWFGWDVTGNWMIQAMIFSQGGNLVTPDEKKVLLDSKESLWVFKTIARIVNETKMQGYNADMGRADFGSGRVGIYVWSTSDIGAVERLKGDKFEMRCTRFPLNEAYGKDNGRLPVGGNGAMIHATDPEKQKAAWEYIKFITSPFGSTEVVKTTGYMPVNSIAAKSPEYLAGFYDTHPNRKVSITQLPVMRSWYAFPGPNAIKITDIIKDKVQSIVSRQRSGDVENLVKEMTQEVQALMPN
jgi:multiple sugar transport system substrate-binding protein